MKLVSVTVPGHVLDELRDTLLSIGIKGMTISPATHPSFDETDPEFDCSRPSIFENALDIRLETVVNATLVNEIVRAILAACDATAQGGISILVSDVIRAVRVRNAEILTEG
jgi:nitrogen regulatory protein PII